MNYNVVNKLGEVVKEIELNEAVFGVEYNEQCVFDAIMVARSITALKYDSVAQIFLLC